MLRVHQHREELQIIAERRTYRELTQPRRAPRKCERAIGQSNARDRRLSEGFDLTGFEDSLRHWASLGACLSTSSPQPRQRSSAFGNPCAGLRNGYLDWTPLLTSRNHARWCFHAQPGVTPPRVMARIDPLTQMPA